MFLEVVLHTNIPWKTAGSHQPAEEINSGGPPDNTVYGPVVAH